MKSKFIGVISDTHISDNGDHLPIEVFRYFEDAVAIFHAGDITNQIVIDDLKQIAPVYAVRGNMDIGSHFQEILPESLNIELFGINFAITHGGGSPKGLTTRVFQMFKDKSPDCIVFGHTHLPFNEKINNTLLFNPGSTCGIKGSVRTVGILDLTAGFLSGKIIDFQYDGDVIPAMSQPESRCVLRPWFPDFAGKTTRLYDSRKKQYGR